MTGSNRIHGAALALSFGGTDYWADATSVVLDNEESSAGVTTFADAAAGGARKFFFTVSAIQSTQAASFWRYVWANTGNTVAYIYAPHGNAEATADQPHFIGTTKVGPKPTIGGAAGLDVDQVFEVRFDIVTGPTLDAGASAAPVISNISPTGAEPDELVVISGTRFTGTTGVTFDGGAVEFVVVSDSTISAASAGEGEVPVIVTTGEGASNTYTYPADPGA